MLAINQMTKHVSMLAKELLLTMLDRGSPMPALDQAFFAGLYVSMWRGRCMDGTTFWLATVLLKKKLCFSTHTLTHSV